MSADGYAINDRIWLKSEGVWWPARIIDPTDFGLETNENTRAVMYYGTNDADVNVNVSDSETVTPFEITSTKAAAPAGSELFKAVTAARNDPEANPLANVTAVSVVPIGQKRARSPEETAAPTITTSSVHHHDRKHGADLLKETVSSSSITAIKDRLNEAIASGTVSDVRRCLIQLGGSRMTFDLLRETRAGVAVGEVLRHEEFQLLFALARALLGDWLSKLPKNTLDALQDEAKVWKTIREKQDKISK